MSNKAFKIIVIITAIAAMIFFGRNLLDPSRKLQKQIDEGAFLVDVRTPQEYSEGHVPGSTNIPLDSVESSLDQFRNKEHIVVFCRSGNRSGKAKDILERNGIKNVTNGGAWQDVNKLVNNK